MRDDREIADAAEFGHGRSARLGAGVKGRREHKGGGGGAQWRPFSAAVHAAFAKPGVAPRVRTMKSSTPKDRKIISKSADPMHFAGRSQYRAPWGLNPERARSLAHALIAALGIVTVAAPAAADGAFPFKSLRVDNLVFDTADRVVFDNLGVNSDANRDERADMTPTLVQQETIAQLDVFESGRLLTWQVAGEFVGQCIVKGSSSGVAIVYGPAGAKSGQFNCDGVEAGLFGPLRRILTGTYQSKTTVSGNVVELTGDFTGRAQIFMRPSDSDPTYVDVGTVRQHGKFQITPTGCKVLVYETESNVRVDYNNEDDDYRQIKDTRWVEHVTPTTTCQVTR